MRLNPSSSPIPFFSGSRKLINPRFNTGIADSLNAEIALGTVGSIWEGVSWLGYTYMFVRMKKNPMVYGMGSSWWPFFSIIHRFTFTGINHDSRLVDPDLSAQRRDYINAAANSLVATKMIQLDKATEAFTITDRGRIAAKYYVQRGTIETFNKEMRPKMTEADLLRMLCMSNEVSPTRGSREVGPHRGLIV